MSDERGQNLSSPSPEKNLLELFKNEIETQVKTLSEGLLDFHHHKNDLKRLEPLMRAAHSLKGAAKVFSFEPIVQLAHAMEDCFLAAQAEKIVIDEALAEIFFEVLDALGNLAQVATVDLKLKLSNEKEHYLYFTHTIHEFISKHVQEEGKTIHQGERSLHIAGKEEKESVQKYHDRVLRLTAQHLNRLMGLAAESMVETKWLQPFCDSLQRLKLAYNQMTAQFDYLKKSIDSQSAITVSSSNEISNARLLSITLAMREYYNELTHRVTDLEMFINRHSNLTDRLYNEIIESRMRPFADGLGAFPRMVWETAHHLKKQARLEIYGKSTLIDRDILEKLEVPLGHLLRNAIDHGIENPDERIALGKPPEGVIHLEASHKGGMLSITVSDDGRGIDLDVLRKLIVKKKMISEDSAQQLTEKELLDFLFYPGFSLSKKVTDLSGRGIGLDIVKNMIEEVAGSIHIINHPGKGVSFYLQLPLTLSVIRALVCRVNKTLVAFPLAQIDRVLKISKDTIEHVEDRAYITCAGVDIGLVSASRILHLGETPVPTAMVNIVILKSNASYYGIILDEFWGEKELVLQEIESNKGKLRCISAGAVTENGEPVLIIDVEEMMEALSQQYINEI